MPESSFPVARSRAARIPAMGEGDSLEVLLKRLGSGEGDLAEEVFARVHDELRAMARRHMAGERAGHTLEPTALVNEAYLRLVGRDAAAWDGRAHFFHAAARAMRQILVEHARARGRLKRGGGHLRVAVSVEELAFAEDPSEFLAVDDAIRRLEEVDPRTASVVKLRLYAGLGTTETAELLGLSTRTVEREWAYARAWLYEALG